MKTEYILKADLLDIIFENRNKNYGAYPLRKYYNERVYKALGITFLFVLVLASYIFLYKAPKITLAGVDTTDIIVLGKKKINPEVTPPAIKKPKQPAIQKPLRSAIFVSTIKIVDSTEKASKLSKNLDSAVIAGVTNDGPGTNKPVVKADPVSESTTGAVNGTGIIIDRTKPLASAEVMPAYPGGTDALIKFLQRNLRNPQDLEENEMVSVKIKFIVGYDGVLKGFETVEDGGTAFNNEVIRVLKKMPSWLPGKSAGENVSVYYTIPVKFIPQQ